MSRWSGVAVGTTHRELSAMVAGEGGLVFASAGDLDRATASPVSGVLVTQDLDGLTPEQVRSWAQKVPVAVWLEEDPPPAWRSLPAPITVWCGELDEATLMDWVDGLRPPSGFGDAGRVRAVLGVAGGVGVTSTAWRWGQQLALHHGPGLWVDADWSQAGLTERLCRSPWDQHWSFDRPVACPAGRIIPAPPPWSFEPVPDSGYTPEQWVLEARGFVMVDLGRDLRSWVAARWAAVADHVVVVGHANQLHRVREAIKVLRELNPDVSVGVKGLRGSGDFWGSVVSLSDEWPAPTRTPAARHLKGVSKTWRAWFMTKTGAVFARSTPENRTETWPK